MSSITSWSELPDHILVQAFSYLSTLSELSNAALTCRKWFEVFMSPILWRHVEFNFYRGFDVDKNQLICIDRFGAHIRSVIVRLDQYSMENRLLATEAITKLADVSYLQNFVADC